MISNICAHTFNPLNIRYSSNNSWSGQMGKYQGFVCFENFDYGFRAACILIRNYIFSGYNTASKIISRWAPPSENDTYKYIQYVHIYMSATKLITYVDDFVKLIALMSRYETGYIVSHEYIHFIINHFKILNYNAERKIKVRDA